MPGGRAMRCLALAVVMLVAFVASAWAISVRCEINAKYACSARGCDETKPGAWNVVDFEAETILRCDANGCDTYQMQAVRKGIYINIEVPGRSMFAKMTTDGSDYVEVVSLGTDVLVSYGACR